MGIMRLFFFLVAVACQKFAHGMLVASDESRTLEQAIRELGGKQQILEQLQTEKQIIHCGPSSVREGDLFVFRLQPGETEAMNVYSVNKKTFGAGVGRPMDPIPDRTNVGLRGGEFGAIDVEPPHAVLTPRSRRRKCQQWLTVRDDQLVATVCRKGRFWLSVY